MKISSSDITLASSHRSGQIDITQSGTSGSVILAGRGQSLLADPGPPPGVLDRVTLSRNKEERLRSEYSAHIRSAVKVENQETGNRLVIEHQKTVENLVGAVIDRKIIASSLGRPRALTGMNQETITPLDRGRLKEWSLTKTLVHYEQEQAFFFSRGFVATEDGRSIGFSLDLALDRAFLSETREETFIRLNRMNLTDPLVICLDKGVPSLSELFFSFDLDNDGKQDRIHFASPGSGFLALDRNQDGQINNGSELFGPGTGNGFDELAVFDEDQNSWIDEADQVFGQLRVWTRDENGEQRLISLKDAGVGAIFLGKAATEFNMTGSGNELKGRVRSFGLFLHEDGNVGSVQQIDLVRREETSGQEDLFLANGSQGRGRFKALPAEKGGVPGLRNWTGPEVPVKEGSLDTNPLEQLLERIRELKEKMKHLLEPEEGTSGVLAGRRRKRNRPGYLVYRMVPPDSPLTGSGAFRRMRM